MGKNSDMEKRQSRRVRRVRNQILAYLFLIIIIAGIGVGGYFGVKTLASKLKVNTPMEESVSEDEGVVSEDEAVGVIATPEDIEETMEEILGESEEEEVVVQENAMARAYVDSMTLEQKVAGLFISTPEAIMNGVDNATAAGDSTRAALEEVAVGGFLYKPSNVQSTDQFGNMIADTQEMYKEIYNTDMWIALDKDNASEYIESGVNLMIMNGDSFSNDTGAAINAVAYFPYQDGNVPETSEETIDEMREMRFNYFADAINNGADAIVMADTIASNATGDGLPCTLSYAMITEVIRQELGFNGVIITGYMDNANISGTYSAGDAALMAIQAGADMILCSENTLEAYDAVLTAVQSGTLDESRIDQSLMRIYTAKYE